MFILVEVTSQLAVTIKQALTHLKCFLSLELKKTCQRSTFYTTNYELLILSTLY